VAEARDALAPHTANPTTATTTDAVLWADLLQLLA
jgi:hypothetical protein